jgi:hypothetical protein
VPGVAQRVLWVEGKDDVAVVNSLCAAHRLPKAFTVEEHGGVDPLLEALPLELRSPSVERLGIAIDANGDVSARWDAIRHILSEVGYTAVPPVLPEVGIILPAAPRRPVFGAWLMPDNSSPGAIEDFVATLIPQDDVLWPRAVKAVDSIPAEERRFPEARRAKAVIHTWLSWQKDPGSPMGQGIGKGDLDAHAPAAERFVAWLRRLMLSDELDGTGEGIA